MIEEFLNFSTKASFLLREDVSALVVHGCKKNLLIICITHLQDLITLERIPDFNDAMNRTHHPKELKTDHLTPSRSLAIVQQIFNINKVDKGVANVAH